MHGRASSAQGWLSLGLVSLAAAALSRSLGNRRLCSLGHVVMAVGLVLPVIRPGIGSIMLSAIIVGGTFTVITMAGFQEGREVGGLRIIAAMASAFAVGQIGGPSSCAM